MTYNPYFCFTRIIAYRCRTKFTHGVRLEVLPSTLWKKLSENFELSEYEAKAYLSLVMGGACKARKLSLICGVPRTRIYGTLKKLMERGLVVEIVGEPRKFAPTSPAKALESLLQSCREKTSDRVISLVESDRLLSLLEEAYKNVSARTEPERGEIWIIRRRSEILRRIREMLCRAERSVNVITTEKGLILFYKAFHKLLDKLVEDGVKVRTKAPISSYNGSLARELKYVCQVRHVDVRFPVLFLCVDDRELLLVELRPDSFSIDSGEDVGVFSRNPTLCALISLMLP